uniref:Uncharacterized protein n=1 Tax=Inoviridae sp. ct0MH15 TaxID=2825775 RepID=A0A8S5VFP7_9VIRU|nr:MAG TPA: hypothetical protein [Inoviridae sp. ct0MH15]
MRMMFRRSRSLIFMVAKGRVAVKTLAFILRVAVHYAHINDRR